MVLPFLESKDYFLGIADALPNAAVPQQVIDSFDGTIDEEFMEWWIPQQETWQTRAELVFEKIFEAHPVVADEVASGKFPGWFDQWWWQVLNFPWASRLGEAVESAEEWLADQ